MIKTVGTLFVDKLLEEITDYEWLNLTKKEKDELYNICQDLEDKEDVEREINIYIQTIGYDLAEDTSVCYWLRLKDYINEDNLDIDIEDAKKVMEYFELTDFELVKIINEGDMRTFSDFDEFFRWMFEDTPEWELIDTLKRCHDGESILNEEQYLTLNDGSIVFMYM